MSKPRKCPQCGVAVAIADGYTFDADLNMVCAVCGRIVFPTTPTAETEIQRYKTEQGPSKVGAPGPDTDLDVD